MGFPCEKKSVGPVKLNASAVIENGGNSFIFCEDHALQVLKCKSGEDCLHSMNVPASALEDLRGNRPLVLSFR
jgi:hypothetical protein